MSDGSVISVRVMAIRYEAEGIVSLILRRQDGVAFNAVDPGAHVDLHLPDGTVRSYSLSNGDGDRGDYRITVARATQSLGGSAFIHDRVRVGESLTISAPRNTFPLVLEAPLSVFIAGGIGITPFMPMLAELNKKRRSWKLIYSTKTKNRAAFLPEIEQLAAFGTGQVSCHFTGEHPGTKLNLCNVLPSLPTATHFYCCGPPGMLESFRQSTGRCGIASKQVHFEYFENDTEAATEGGFIVVLQRSGKRISVRTGQTILEAIEEAGIQVPFSCREGICGRCETRVLSGKPDHRDRILSDEERASGTSMMICCSGARSAELLLDL